MKTYRIADVIVGMAVSGRTLKQAQPYEIPQTTPEMIVYSKPEALREIQPHLSLDDCEYILTGDCFYKRLSFFDGMMIHSSCVVVDGKAYLFSAPSGVGKSTHTELWLKLLGDRAYILNDDKPALRIVDGKLMAYGTPWSGATDRAVNHGVPVGGIAVLKRAEDNRIRLMSPSEALFYIMDQSMRFSSDEDKDRFYAILGQVIGMTKIYELSCNMDISSAKLSYETMTEMRLNENED